MTSASRARTADGRRRQAAFAAFDRANSRDPKLEPIDARQVPRALAYAQRMTVWLERLYPEAPEALRLAARCQHIERWQHPRAGYPAGRRGYLEWRRDLKSYHARRAGEILAEAGYGAATIARVQSLLRKEKLKRDADAQALEDVVCVVFLAHDFADFAARHEPDKVASILRKTWRKMSPRGRRAALALPLQGRSRSLIEAALGAGGTDP